MVSELLAPFSLSEDTLHTHSGKSQLTVKKALLKRSGKTFISEDNQQKLTIYLIFQ
jgi:hypothetical protein